MKKLFMFVLVLLIIATAGMGFYIATIDWNKHKNIISQQFYELTGKQIVFSGPISFKIFPSPYLQASNVTILSGVSDDKPLIEANNLVANLSLIPLLQGNFDINKMILTQPQINFELQADGRLNWQSQLSIEQRRKIESSEIALNSVTLKDATVNIDILSKDISLKLTNLNGEVVAQSAMGPFRIEGNYIKNNEPQGFAISIGQLSDSFATTLNFVLTHPESESYTRFDGSFMLGNKVLNGNLIIEAKKLQQFLRSNLSEFNLPSDYDYPLAITTEINLNEKQLNLSNMVIKYGETQGAGTSQLVFNDGFGNNGTLPRINTAFNFTDLNLTPVVKALSNFIKQYSANPKSYNPDLGIDILADIKSIRTTYNNQQIKSFNLGLDVIDNVVTINNFNATVPGDTNITLSGNLKSIDDEIFYNLETNLNSHDFLKTLKWINLEPNVSTAATYRKASGEAKISGTLDKIQISPISFTLDKSSFSGEAGIKLGNRPDIMLIINSDMINFDNYISALPEEESDKNWGQRMAYRFSKLGFLNNIDLQINSNIDLAIYEKMPFENINFKANLLDGKMDIEKLQIKSVADAKIEISGQLSDFGKEPNFNNINYNIQSDNLSSLINKLELKAPNWNYKNLKKINANGAISGNLSSFSTQTKILLENIELNYKGQINNSHPQTTYNGELELKHSDFVKMLNDLNFSYNPQTPNLGILNLSTQINGTISEFKAENIIANIGFNNFSGNINYALQNSRPLITTTLDINKFEVERFLHRNSNNTQLNITSSGKSSFWDNPQWADEQINYDFYKTFDLNGNFNIQNLSYKKDNFNTVSTSLSLENGTLNISEFKSSYLNGTLEADGKLQMQPTPLFDGTFNLSDGDLNLLPANGNKYGLSNGKFNTNFKISGSANSEKNFFQTLNGNGKIQINTFEIKGWDITKIYEDLIKRETPEGLAVMVKNNLETGNTPINFLTTDFAIETGIINLKNGLLSGTNFQAPITGNINIADWNMNLLFNIKFNEPKHFPELSFAFKDNISSPIPDIDVSGLFNMYKSQQDKKNAVIQAENELQLNKLKNALQAHKQTSDSLLADLQNKITPELNSAKEKAFDDTSSAEYEELQNKLSEISKALAHNSLSASTDSPTEEELSRLENANHLQTQAIEQLHTKLNALRLSDTQKRSKQLFDQINSAYDQSASLIQEYTTTQELVKSRLSHIITDYDPSKDNKLLELEEKINKQSIQLKTPNSQLLDRFSFMVSRSNIEQLNEYNQELSNFLSQITSEVTNFQYDISEYIKYSTEQATQKEQEYKDQLRAEEVERKIEENTGYINIKKSGKTVTVSRDIEEIEKAEEMSADSEIKVLDFSKPKTNSNISEPKQQNVVKKGRLKIK